MAQEIQMVVKPHSTYRTHYQIIWHTDHKRPWLTPVIQTRLKASLVHTIANWDGELLNVTMTVDTVSLEVRLPPTIAPSNAVKTLKSQTAKQIVKQFPQCRQWPAWRGKLWQRWYYFGSIGHLATF